MLLPAAAEAREPTPHRRIHMQNLDHRFEDVAQEAWASTRTLKENNQHETQISQGSHRHVVAEGQMWSNECAVCFETQVIIPNDRTTGRISILAELSVCFEQATKARFVCRCVNYMPVGGMLRRPPCVDSSNELALPIRCCS